MTTEEQLQSLDLQKLNGTEDENTNEHDDEAASDTSSTPTVRRSRFFRSKRKHRLNEDPSPQVDDNVHASNEPTNSSETPKQSNDETSDQELSTTDTDGPIIQTVPTSFSPPPSTDDATKVDSNSISPDEKNFPLPVEDIDAERQAYLAKKKVHAKESLIEPRPSLPTLYSGYQRKKSQSVKLIRNGPLDACPKKNVRFADDFGLDLSQIKVIKSDELPQVPSEAFKDLRINPDDDSYSSSYQQRMKTITYLEQKFENPIHAHGFEDRVSRHKVVLEQANAIDNRIYGTIKIISYGLKKRVKIRLTTDNWMTHQDHDAIYIMDSFDGTHDRFTFTLDVDRNRIFVGNIIQFCISYESYIGPDYWDNNYQQNYRFDCISRTIPDYSS